jgi:hypothetical protein
MSVMADIQRQQAEVQHMQAKHLAQHEQRLGDQQESMRLPEITDKLDGLIGFRRRQFPDPK